MKADPLLPLRVHTPYSFYEGASWAEELAEQASAAGHRHLAATDRNRVSGLVRAFKAARDQELKPLLGLLLDDPADPGRYALLWAQSLAGYGQLCQWATKRQLEPSFRLEQLALQPPDELLLATADPTLLRKLRSAMGRDNLYGELRAFRGDAQRRAALATYDEARRLELPFVATGNVAMARAQQHGTVELLHAVGQRQVLQRAQHGSQGGNPIAYEEMVTVAKLFDGLPEAIRASHSIAERCEGVDLRLGELKFPDPDLPGGRDPFAELKERAERGLHRRYGPAPPEPARQRLAYELAVTERLGFTGYMLVVHDIARRAWARSVRTLGRGSAANSIICYSLGLTDICPLKHDLYFERFLNPERSTPPDIDLDFSWRDRDEILTGVYESYGHDRVAMISTTVTFGARGALREAALARGLPEAEIRRVTKMVPHFAHPASLGQLHREVAECRDLPLDREPWASIAASANQLLHLPRHLSIHAGGVVITRGPITEWSGLERASKGFVVTHYDMYGIEDLGLVKIDLLSQRSLGVLKDAVAMVREGSGGEHEPPMDDLDAVFHDPATRSLLAAGDTMGVFYTESPGMMTLNRKLRCDNFELLVAASSVIRPGVSESGMMQQFVERVRDPAKTDYLHPIMERLLGQTHGVMIYQEDVIKVAHHLAGMPLGRADLLRRAMSGKYRSRDAMAQLSHEFTEGCAQRGIEAGVAEEVWRQIESFAGYSFCKAHSASFAVLSMQIAYLKAHHPAEFLAAVLANGGGYYSQAAYVEEARRIGIDVKLPDINHSGLEHRGQPGCIQLGLRGIGSLRDTTPQHILDERSASGAYPSLPEFVRRVRPARDEAEALVACGAFDALGPNRPTLLRNLRAGYESYLSGPGPLALGASDPFEDLAPAPDWDDARRYRAEKRLLGFSPGPHPLELLDLPAEGQLPARELERNIGQRVSMVGWAYSHKRIKTRKRGQTMEFLSMEDLTGAWEVTLFPRVYAHYAVQLRRAPHGPWRITGRVEEEQGVCTLIAETLELLGNSAAVLGKGGRSGKAAPMGRGEPPSHLASAHERVYIPPDTKGIQATNDRPRR